ncbi:LysR family transcriptional regulator [Paenarthrobacter sp. NPDC090522]|uniref:LysR family transcriptional regulator n=1 Tax=Paenarthrobacter sp. NPDC090522 TaxID=3364383 RepID=UPI003821557E
MKRLRLLREVSLRGTLAAAAEALDYNASSVSHQLKLLEQEVGAPLLEPVGRKVRLTNEARILVEHAEAIFRHLEAAKADIALSRERVSGTVRVASFQTAGHAVIPAALRELQHQHPELDVTVSHIPVEAALPGLLARDFDIVLQEDYPGHPQITVDGAEITTAGRDPLWLVTGISSNQQHLSDLSEAAWVLEPEGTLARRWATAACRHEGFEPRVRFESSDVMLHLRLVAEGLGAALVPGLALEASNVEGLALSELPGRPARRIALAIRSGSGHSPAITAVRQAIAGQIAEKLAAGYPEAS